MYYDSIFSGNDDAVLCQVFQTLMDHAHDQKYTYEQLCILVNISDFKSTKNVIVYCDRTLNVKNLSKILNNPEQSLNILKLFGFVSITKKNSTQRYLKYQPSEALHTTTILQVYALDNISCKLFHLAWNLLLCSPTRRYIFEDQIKAHLKQLRSNNYNNISIDCKPVGVYCISFDVTKPSQHMAALCSLTLELLNLPNQHYCKCLTIKQLKIDADEDECIRDECNDKCTLIYILDNNGSEYKSIDWNKMDFESLISDMPDVVRQSYVECKRTLITKPQNKYDNRDEARKEQFIKKVAYFGNKFSSKLSAFSGNYMSDRGSFSTRYSGWPRYFEELIMREIRKYPTILYRDLALRMCVKMAAFYNQVFWQKYGNNAPLDETHEYFYRSQHATQLIQASITQQDLELFSSKVKRWVKTIVQPRLNHHNTNERVCEKMLNGKYNWKCFLCNHITSENIEMCDKCSKNETNRWGLISLNPFFYPKKNKSKTFCVKKPFGLIYQKSTVNISTDRYLAKLKNKYITITFDASSNVRFIIVCEKQEYNKILTVGDLKSILFECVLAIVYPKNSSYYEYSANSFGLKKHTLFSQFTDDDVLAVDRKTHCYHIDFMSHCQGEFFPLIRWKHKIHFGNKYFANNNNNTSGGTLVCLHMIRYETPDPFEHCPFFAFDNINCNTINKTNYSCKSIIDHLSEFDHFEAFDIRQPYCIYRDKCDAYQNVLSNNATFENKIHLYYYNHPHFCHNKYSNNNQERIFNTLESKLKVDKMYQQLLKKVNITPSDTHLLCHLVKEVIDNNFMQDLLPRHQIDRDTAKVYISSMINELNTPNYEQSQDTAPGVVDYLSKQFKLFEKVKEKMHHSRHKRTGFVLNYSHMLALILYCDGECNYSLSQSQRDKNNTFLTKWPYFDTLLNNAIQNLSMFEEHWENIYHGACDVYYEFKNKNRRDTVYFASNVSFSSDLEVAKRFRSSEGLIIGLNMKRSFSSTVLGAFRACDVSWISKLPNEKEILCKRGSMIQLHPNRMTQVGKTQYLVADDGNPQETSYPSMFVQ